MRRWTAASSPQSRPWCSHPLSRAFPSSAGLSWPLIGGLAVGLVVGFFASVAMTLLGALVYDGLDTTSDVYFMVPQVLPLALSVFLLAFKRTRIAGAGLVMGVAIGAIVMPGVCVALVSSGVMG